MSLPLSVFPPLELANTVLPATSKLIVGHSAQITAGNTPLTQILGTTGPTGSLLLGCFSATDGTRSEVGFLKSGAASIGAGGTIVATNENCGGVVWYVDDGTDLLTPIASIEALALATQGANDAPGAIQFNCTTDGASTVVEVGRFSVAAGLTLGVTGTTVGKLSLSGNTSGTVTLSVSAAAGTWTMKLPGAVGSSGQQLTDAAGDGVCTWAAAGSLRQFKEILGEVSGRAEAALSRLLGAGVYDFQYKDEPGAITTGDHTTVYTGVMGDEFPEVMHFGGTIFNPVSAFGQCILALKALAGRIARLETAR